MPRKCTICAHKDRNKIDSALAVEGAVLRTIAVRYRINKSSLKRHMDNGHVSEKIMQAQHVHEVIEADSVLSQMGKVKEETWIIHSESRARTRTLKDKSEIPDPDNELALKALARLERQIEIESKILGVTKDQPAPVTVNLNISEEVKKLVGILPAVKF
jgi:hypothetical protein